MRPSPGRTVNGDFGVLKFQWPWMILLLLIPVYIYLFKRRRANLSMDRQQRQVTLLHPALQNLQTAFNARRPGINIGTRTYYILLAALWLGITGALMRP